MLDPALNWTKKKMQNWGLDQIADFPKYGDQNRKKKMGTKIAD